MSYSVREAQLPRNKHFFTLALVLLSCSTPASAGTAPPWMQEAARITLPGYPPETPGVALLDEEITTINEKGEVRTLYRKAYRILRTSGRYLGTVKIYFTDETKISNFRAWSIPAKGEPYEIKDKDAIEAKPYSGGVLYDDQRVRIVEIPEAEPGSVVGFEYEQKQRPYVMQDIWTFQTSIPVKTSRYVLNLPPGWEVETTWRNHPAKEPIISGTQYRWELTDIPALRTEEQNVPDLRGFAGRMALNFYSTSNKTDKMHRSWNDIGVWYNNLVSGRRAPSPAMQQKVKELTAGKTALMDKIRALAAFAQRDVRYVAIEIGIGGFQPHFASDIFANRYGDCKDKATVLGAMLKEIGVDSYYVIVQTKRGVVAKDFPYYGSFNHAIIAIRLPESEPIDALPAVYQHSSLGKLLLFDPTDSITPLGLIPDSEQANHALLVTDKGGELIELPLQPPQSNQLVRTAKLNLSEDGGLYGEVREVRTGSTAMQKRAELLAMQGPERAKAMENFLSGFLNRFTLSDYKVEGLEDYDRELVVTYSFQAPNYAKSMGNLLLVRPRVFGSKSGDNFDYKDRKFPVEIDAATLQTDEFHISVPAGFTVDELPPAVKVDSGHAAYASEAKFENNKLSYKREYKVQKVMIPLEELKQLKGVYTQIAADERNSAVLKRVQ
jgi:hypothetical protein